LSELEEQEACCSVFQVDYLSASFRIWSFIPRFFLAFLPYFLSRFVESQHK